jgi:hypothetical protein
MNDYQKQAADFLSKHGIKFSAKLVNKKSPPWSPDRKVNHFVVTLKHENRRVSFDFFDSIIRFEKGEKELDAYSVLACCSSDYNCPETFEDFCSEFGYDAHDSYTGKKNQQSAQTFAALKKQSAKLQKFFNTEEMQDDLSKIF